MSWQYAFFFLVSKNFISPLRHLSQAQLGADEACRDGEVGLSLGLPAVLCPAASGWPCAVSPLLGPVVMAISS